MKAIINGKRYDTDKATLVGTGSSDVSPSDFRYYYEELYVTPRSRAYFLSGRGGALSRWATSMGNNGYSNGSGIKPLSREDAMRWAETYLPSDVIEKHFADVVEDA